MGTTDQHRDWTTDRPTWSLPCPVDDPAARCLEGTQAYPIGTKGTSRLATRANVVGTPA